MDRGSASLAFLLHPPWWVRLVLALDLLDLTTSLPSAYNNVNVMRGGPLLAAQLLLALWAVAVFVPGSTRALRSFLDGLPLPTAAKWVLVPCFALQFVFIALKIERYPLTNVGMFTYRIQPWRNPRALPHQYLVEEGDTVTPVSLRRFGDPFFSPGPYLDHQLALIYLKYPRHAQVQEAARRRLEAQGRPAPEVRSVLVRFDDAGWHWVSGTAR